MAVARMPEAFFDLAEHHLPPERYVGPAGGRPPIDNWSLVKTLWFVLATGCRWEDVPPELGCSGRSAHRLLQLWEEMGCWDRLHADLLEAQSHSPPERPRLRAPRRVGLLLGGRVVYPRTPIKGLMSRTTLQGLPLPDGPVKGKATAPERAKV